MAPVLPGAGLVREHSLRIHRLDMKFLADANVLSEAMRPSPDPRVLEWFAQNEAALEVNPVILEDIECGILVLPEGSRRNRLQAWFRAGVQKIRGLDLDARTAPAWAALLAGLKSRGVSMPVKDSPIAASAQAHQLTVVTRNLRGFEMCGVTVLSPFSSAKPLP